MILIYSHTLSVLRKLCKMWKFNFKRNIILIFVVRFVIVPNIVLTDPTTNVKAQATNSLTIKIERYIFAITVFLLHYMYSHTATFASLSIILKCTSSGTMFCDEINLMSSVKFDLTNKGKQMDVYTLNT